VGAVRGLDRLQRQIHGQQAFDIGFGQEQRHFSLRKQKAGKVTLARLRFSPKTITAGT